MATMTETSSAASITPSARRFRADLAGSYGPCLVLLEYKPGPETGDGVWTFDLVRIDATAACTGCGSGQPAGQPRYGDLELWIAAYAPDRRHVRDLVQLLLGREQRRRYLMRAASRGQAMRLPSCARSKAGRLSRGASEDWKIRSSSRPRLPASRHFGQLALFRL